MTDTELVAALAEEVRGVIQAERELTARQIADLRAEFEERWKGIPAPRDGRDGVDGKDGRDGVDGKDGLNGVDGKGLDGKDGRDGRDGKDGVASIDEVRAIATKAVDDRIEQSVQKRVVEVVGALPTLQYRGVFREGEAYRAGDCATWAGSVWHANEPTTEKPGEGSKAWTLAVKRGRDGKDAR